MNEIICEDLTQEELIECHDHKPQVQPQQRRQPYIKNSSLWISSSDPDPFNTRFRISSTDGLDAITDRDVCSKCLKSRKYYCYSCYTPLKAIASFVPFVRLPVKVDIIKHIQEVDGKSTCAHAAIIAPEDTTVYNFPDIPDWTDQRVVLVFPGPNAQTLNQLFDNFYDSIDSQESANNDMPFDKVVFIDSTWRQTKQILADPRVSRLAISSSVILKTHNSLFWRHQKNTSRTFLSTIEAIYYFFDDLNKILEKRRLNSPDGDGQSPESEHRYDNLLFFFKHTYNRLRLKYNI